jgi:glycosyltransferase involved in cell wall biosynthesis
MKCGCPVLVSDIPVLREVCGEAAIYFNPHHIEDIRNTIEQFLKKNDTLRPTVIAKGYENANRFSWEKTAKKIILLAQHYK